jgi:hypothetical protein
MRALILFVILLLWTTDLPAQHPVLAEGQRVRISVCLEVARDRVRCSGRIAGTMVEETAGNLIIRHQQDSGIYAIPLNSIQRLQVPKGRKRRTVTSAVVGSVRANRHRHLAAIVSTLTCGSSAPGIGEKQAASLKVRWSEQHWGSVLALLQVPSLEQTAGRTSRGGSFVSNQLLGSRDDSAFLLQ